MANIDTVLIGDAYDHFYCIDNSRNSKLYYTPAIYNLFLVFIIQDTSIWRPTER